MLAQVKDCNGHPALYINDKPFSSSIAMISTRTRSSEEPIIFNKEYFKNLGKSGVKIFLLSCNTPWAGEDYFELFDQEVRMLLEVVPDAYIIARFALHPSKEWFEQNPDECIMYEDGTKVPFHIWTESKEYDVPGFYSLCSSKWREDAADMLCIAWQKVLSMPYGDRIIGCMPTAGKTSEWLYPHVLLNHEKKAALDHSKAFKREFSDYLRQVYKTDENLKKHWNMPEATIDDPIIPTYDQYYFADKVDNESAIFASSPLSNAPSPASVGNGTNFGAFIDFDKHQAVYDFLRTWHLGTAKSEIYFAKRIKEITPDRIVGFCYGSQGNVHQIFSSSNGGTRLILDCPYIDFIENPSVYQNRQPGGCVGQRVVLESFALHNKLYICQDDTRTCAENSFYRDKFGIYDMTDTIEVLKREFGKVISEDMGQWWFDQLVGGKRFNYPEVFDLFTKQEKIRETAMQLDRKKKNDVALIFSEETFQAVSYQTIQDSVARLRNYEIPRIGTGVDQYYHNDMANPDMPSYKLYVFVNTYILTEEEKEVIHNKLRKDNAIALWLYAPGFVNPKADKKMSTAAMKELTGFNLEMINEYSDPTFRFDGEKHPITDAFDCREFYGRFTDVVKNNLVIHRGNINYDTLHFDSYLYPMFYVNDENATTLGHFANGGQVALSMKKYKGFTSIYYAPKYIRHDVLREFARYAGAHIWCESEDVTYPGKNYITLHASSGGEKTLHFPKPMTATEVYEDKCYGENVTQITFKLHKGETKTFRIE